MSQFVVYTAMSLDGYIADEKGDVHWLESFERDEYGYDGFIESVGSILMGRITCEQVLGFGEWPYRGIPTLVWSGSGVESLPEGVLSWSGDIEETVSKLEELSGSRNVWILGGASVIQAFIWAGMVHRMDLFIVPVLLGGGVRLFGPEDGEPLLLKLEHVQPYANGVVQITYEGRYRIED